MYILRIMRYMFQHTFFPSYSYLLHLSDIIPAVILEPNAVLQQIQW